MQSLAYIFGLKFGIFGDNVLCGHPIATRLTTNETVIRIPRMQARPPIPTGSNVIRSKIELAYRFSTPRAEL